jgi:hypothetical protein
MFVSFGPLNNFPKINPPKSEPIQPNNIINKRIFNPIIFENKKNIIQKIKIKIIKNRFIGTKFNLFLKIFFEICKNSKIDKTPKIIKK